jgi:hypothetical protein
MTGDPVIVLAFSIFVGWILLITAYYVWAIRYHVVNYGLSKRMWKILYPEALARTGFGKERLKKIRQEMVQRRIEEAAVRATANGEEAEVITTPFDVPKENPHKNDSFGLPPGTVRGTLALTALVMFILVEGVNLFSEHNLEGHFEGLITALQMVLAFYFGSKAVDVLKARQETVRKRIEHGVEEPPPKRYLPRRRKPEGPSEPDLPSEQPAMVTVLSEDRLINIAEETAPKAKPTSEQTKNWHTRAELGERTLALTASFETGQPFPNCFGVIAGNFDGQGLSFGALQWNIGQGTLQALWQSMREKHPDAMEKVLGSKCSEFVAVLKKTKAEQSEWAKSLQYTTEVRGRRVWRVVDEWKKPLQELGKTEEMIKLQVESAQVRYNIARSNCRHFELTTERGVALMFDINVQNGKVNRSGAGDRIFSDYMKIPAELSDEEKQVEKMKIIATRRSEVSHPRWREDVKARKMTIALGEGTVHGRNYDLKADYNIPLKPFA